MRYVQDLVAEIEKTAGRGRQTAEVLVIQKGGKRSRGEEKVPWVFFRSEGRGVLLLLCQCDRPFHLLSLVDRSESYDACGDGYLVPVCVCIWMCCVR